MPGISSIKTTPAAAGWGRWHQHRAAAAAARADKASADAWTIFWREQSANSRCCANASPNMRRALDTHWQTFAAGLPLAAKILDIGCGAGAVGRELLSWRPDLRVTGIDIAAIVPSPELRIELLPNTSMECLPFDDRSFGAVVSQFGYEYGRTGDAAHEVARVLPPGAWLSLLVHHAESPIVADSQLLLRALDRLVGPPLQGTFMSGNRTALEQRLAALRRDCPGQRIVDQATLGLRARITGTEAERAMVWSAVVDALAPERTMLRLLISSCVAPADLEAWLGPLAQNFTIHSTPILRISGGRPLAWKIEGRRRKKV